MKKKPSPGMKKRMKSAGESWLLKSLSSSGTAALKKGYFSELKDTEGLGISVLDQKERVISLNSAFCLMMGSGSEALMGKPLAEFLHPKDRRRASRFFNELRKNPRKKPAVELCFISPTGREVILLAIPVAVGLRARQKSLILFFVDHSRWRKKEEKLLADLHKKEVLLREIHHRVKNNIQLVSSLLRLQASAAEDEKLREMLKASQGRVRTISLIHEKLYQSQDLATVDFGDYLRTLASTIFYLSGVSPALVRLEVKASPRIRLEPKRAAPCGLIVNELVLNALKHAFPGDRAGRIRVELKPGPEGRTVLMVNDDGVGLPEGVDIKRPQRLGLQIVADLVKQLDGTMELSRRAGTTFKIVF